MNILIYIKDLEYKSKLETLFLNEKITCDFASDLEELIEKISRKKRQILLVDTYIELGSNKTITSEIRKKSYIPVIMINVSNNSIGFEAAHIQGADIYFDNPNDFIRLLIVIDSLYRRTYIYSEDFVSSLEKTERISTENILLNNLKKTCVFYDKKIKLSLKEFEILWFLLINKGKVINHKQIYCNVWSEEYLETSKNTVAVHITNLRKKLKKIKPIDLIQNVHGIGYVIKWIGIKHFLSNI